MNAVLSHIPIRDIENLLEPVARVLDIENPANNPVVFAEIEKKLFGLLNGLNSDLYKSMSLEVDRARKEEKQWINRYWSKVKEFAEFKHGASSAKKEVPHG
jgi:hypothetical protein